MKIYKETEVNTRCAETQQELKLLTPSIKRQKVIHSASQTSHQTTQACNKQNKRRTVCIRLLLKV